MGGGGLSHRDRKICTVVFTNFLTCCIACFQYHRRRRLSHCRYEVVDWGNYPLKPGVREILSGLHRPFGPSFPRRRLSGTCRNVSSKQIIRLTNKNNFLLSPTRLFEISAAPGSEFKHPHCVGKILSIASRSGLVWPGLTCRCRFPDRNSMQRSDRNRNVENLIGLNLNFL